MAAEVCAVWPGVEPSRSVLGLVDDLLARVGDGAGGAEGTVWARRHGTDWWIASSGERADRCDRLADAVDGPRRAALATGEPVTVTDVLVDERWDAWRSVVLAAGFRSVVVLPAALRRGERSALCLYVERPGPWRPEDLHRASGLAAQIASLVDLHSTIPARTRTDADPVVRRRSALAVEQAVGVLMARRGCGEDEARQVLATTARAHATSVEELAQAVLTREAQRPEGDGPRG